ncbi:transposase [Oscillochloris sp. ZM17-4]|uniref:RNA-guided endonuclease InsQ/TnpB family protein n=1 Tax=Oscillochloris sp. ZM17-4 TaxID=2866714 RepID=UPI001C72C82C|nr:RNA-guided endonuclease TnpB family protein [Oscillochloris sp. ZM17-4]MBX0331115.1 transposase [Oscillochloris sp. ZM17-4]
MTRTIQTTYRYRLNPTVAQEILLNQFAGARRFVWNWALDRKKTHYQQTGGTLGFAALSAELTALKQQPGTAWLREMDSQSLQQALRDLDSAYQHFFRRIKRGEKRKGFPRFKSRKTDTPRFRIPQRVELHAESVSVPKIGMIRAVVHRPLEGVTKGATFKREPSGHWFVSLVTEQQAAPRTERPVQTHVGIDVGLKSLAVYSTGETIANPRWYRTQRRKLRRAQQALSRKVRGSHNRDKARVVVARLHQKIRNQRNDFLHKLSTDLVRHYDLVSIEDLSIRGLAKTKLATSVLDAGWGMFRSMLEYKADRNDTHVVAIGRFFASSKMCGTCGWIHELTLAVREWDCLNPACGVHHDRDVNAARNIDREGKRLFDLRVAAGHAET